MKKYLVFFLITLFFWGCVEEIKLDTDEPMAGMPTPCFKSDAESCGTTIIPLPSDFAYTAVPAGTDLNISTKLPMTLKFSAAINAETLVDKVIVLSPAGAPVAVKTMLHPLDASTLLISPVTGEWEAGKHTAIVLKGIASVDAGDFVETTAFYYAKEENALVNADGSPTYGALAALSQEDLMALEGLRLIYADSLPLIEGGLKIDRSEYLMLWSVTFSKVFISCLKSDAIPGCKNANAAPVPSDFIMKDGHLDLPIADDASDSTKAMLTAINTLDGWGVTSPFTIQLNEAPKVDTLDANPMDDGKATIFLMKMTATGTVPVPSNVVWDEASKSLVFFPLNGDIWRQKSTYLVALTTGVTNEAGAPLGKPTVFSLMSSDTALAADGKSLFDALDDETALTLEGGRLSMIPAFTAFAANGLEKKDISMMYTVTTQTVTDDLMGLSLLLSSAGNPVDANPLIDVKLPHANIPMILDQYGLTDTDAQDLGYSATIDLYRNIGWLIQGNIDLANYLSDTTGAWDPAKIPSDPTIENTVFLMSVPYVKDSMHPDYCEMPVDGFPVVIFQHGLGGSKEQLFAMANKLAENCYVAIAIDAVKHGDRKEGQFSGENFFSANLFASRDNLRQSVLDLVQLKTAINKMAAPDFAASELPNGVLLDGTKVSYFGISLGGILGTIFMTVSPDVTSGVLNVPGGGLMDILMMTESASIKDPLINALSAQGLEEGTPEFAQFLFLGQLVLDQGDPIAYAHHTITSPLASESFTYSPKAILMQKAVGDEVINNYTTDHLSKVMGIYSTTDTDNFKTYTPNGTYSSKHSFTGSNEVESQRAKDDVIEFYNAVFTGGN